MSTQTTDIADLAKADAYYCEMPTDPCVVVMFGASGDLAKRKLLPALYDLAVHACLAPRFRLVGFARTEMSDDDFRRSTGEILAKKDADAVKNGSQRDPGKRDAFLHQLQYFSGKYDDPESFRRLAQKLDQLDSEGQLGG